MSLHPNPEKLRYMAKEFEKLHRREKQLDFSSPTYHPCCTVACHGGWAGVILRVKSNYLTWEGHSEYSTGARALSSFLNPDWDTRSEFEGWARTHPDLWGNTYSDSMFHADGYRAFGVKKSHECSLQTIADHYKAVADRVQARIQTHLDQEKENVTL